MGIVNGDPFIVCEEGGQISIFINNHKNGQKIPII